MKDFEWKGNIRELKNRIEQAVVLCNSEWLSLTDLSLVNDEKTDKQYNNEILSEKKIEDNNKINISCNYEIFEYNISELPEKIIQAKKTLIEKFEKGFIEYHLNKNEMNVARTADKIGLCRQDLYKKIKKVGVNIKKSRHD